MIEASSPTWDLLDLAWMWGWDHLDFISTFLHENPVFRSIRINVEVALVVRVAYMYLDLGLLISVLTV